MDIKTVGHRIYVSDVQESIHFLRYRPVENQLIIFADDTFQRCWSSFVCGGTRIMDILVPANFDIHCNMIEVWVYSISLFGITECVLCPLNIPLQ